MAQGIKALLVDEAIIFTSGNVESRLHEGAEKLLIRLQHSGLLLGLYHRSSSLGSIKLSILQEFGISLRLLFAGAGEARRLASEWGVCSESCLFLCGEFSDDEGREFSENGWRLARAGSGFNLASVPQLIVKLNMQVSSEFIVVGHCMKWSREKDLLQRGAMPMLPTKSGLAFVPIDLHSSLEQQVGLLSMVLNKATDEIVSVSGAPLANNSGAWIQFSESFQKLESFLADRPEICVVDPTHKVMPLMDRVATQVILHNLEHIQISGGGVVRGPRYLKVTSFEAPDLDSNLEAAKLKLPTIVKPQIACGPSESHRMAIVFEKQGYKSLSVSLPAVIQEYVDHQSTIYKFYVLGGQVFYSTRKSTPDACVLRSSMVSDAPAILFDSLKSLPTGEFDSGLQPDIMAMKQAAAKLRELLGLTIMGFDVVVQSGTQDHVIVDINYFPTFKDVPDAEALPAFWNALQESRAQ